MLQRRGFIGDFRNEEDSERRLKRRFQTGGLREEVSEKLQRGGSIEMALDKRFVTGGSR
jgi:hypothetical protein